MQVCPGDSNFDGSTRFRILVWVKLAEKVVFPVDANQADVSGLSLRIGVTFMRRYVAKHGNRLDAWAGSRIACVLYLSQLERCPYSCPAPSSSFS